MADTGIAIGLDIDDKSIKFVKIKQTGDDVTLLRYDIRDLLPADPAHPESKIKNVSDVIKDIFKGEKPDLPVYVCGFGTNVSLKRATIPDIPQEEIAAAIKWEAKNQVPFSVENAAIGFFKLGEITDNNVKKLNILYAAAADELMQFFAAITKETGIKIAGISIIPLALYSLLLHSKKTEKDKINAIIDIGVDAASINLFKGSKLNFTREITVAGDSITKAMTGLLVADHWQLNLTYEQAEDIKVKYGIPKKDTTEVTENGIPLVHIYEMMSPTLRRLQNEIQRSFDYYKEEFREEKIDNLYITGGSSGLKNLDDFLSSALNIKVEMLDPVEGLKIDPASKIDKEKLKSDSARLALALGEAMERAKQINFMKSVDRSVTVSSSLQGLMKFFKSPKMGNMPTLSVPKISFNLSLAVPIVAIIAFIVVTSSYNSSLDKTRQTLQKELASKSQLLSQVQQLTDRQATMNSLANEETHVRETLSQVTVLLPRGILLTQLQYDNAKRQIWISGESPDTNTIGSFLKNIQDSPNFANTVLVDARKSVVDGIDKIIFRISFNLS